MAKKWFNPGVSTDFAEIGRALAGTDALILGDPADRDSALYTTLSRLLTYVGGGLGLGEGVQIVNSASATITTARHVLVTYTAGTCTLTLPDAAAAREITVWKAHATAIDIVLARSAGDTASGTINGTAASYTLTQGYFADTQGGRWDVVGQAALTWRVSSEWLAIDDLRTTLLASIAGVSGAIDAQGYGVLVVSTASATIGTERLVVVTYSAGDCTLTLPDGVPPREIVIVKAHDVSRNIILNRSATDISNSGTINGLVDSFAVGAGSRRAQYRIAARATYHWELQTRQELSDIEANIVAIGDVVTALEDPGVGALVVSGTSATIADERDVIVTNTSATVNLTLPDSYSGRRITIHKANDTATQTINLIRSAADVTATGTINLVAATRAVVFSSLVSTRRYRSFEIVGTGAAAWALADGDRLDIAAALADIITLDTRVDALDAGTMASVQIVSGATATITAPVVYVDHAAARTDLTLPATTSRFGVTIIKRATSGSFGIRLVPASGSDAIQGLAAGTNFDIPGSTANASTTSVRPSFLVTSSASNVVDVS
jgi:hypothetical protein